MEDQLRQLYQLAESDQWTYVASERADWVAAKRVLVARSTESVLDVGCFDGGFLSSLPPGVSRFGIEINDAAADRARSAGVNVIADTLDDTPEAQFDAAVAFDVIEHVTNPRAFLEALSTHTRSGGVVILSTGNLDSASWRFMRSRYWYSSLPEHLSFTSPAWIRFEAPLAGFRVLELNLYSRAIRPTLGTRLSELAKNTVYRVSPGFFGILRSMGLGSVELGTGNELHDTPPIWLTARNHYLVVLEKLPTGNGQRLPAGLPDVMYDGGIRASFRLDRQEEQP